MDRALAYRLENDTEFAQKISKLCKDYIDVGVKTLNYYTPEFDAAHDQFQGYAQISRIDLEKLDRGHPKRFILPISSTQITTIATFIAQVLAGGDTPHKVEERTPDKALAADNMNQLLMWNAEQQPFYVQIYLWAIDCLIYNRGVMYEYWDEMYKWEFQDVQAEDPDPENATNEIVPADADEYGVVPVDENGNPQMVVKTTPGVYTKHVKVKVKVGGFNRIVVVSPYDFICDPLFPITRFNEGRFSGHKSPIAWLELETRSKLDIDSPNYVSPKGVEKLKEKVSASTAAATVASTGTSAATSIQSRTKYDRTRSPYASPQTADKNDHGVINVWTLRIKIVPKDYDISDETDPMVYAVSVGNGDVVLSIDEDPYLHDQFPYSVGESRPSPHYQFQPGMGMYLKPMQDEVDSKKDLHAEAQARCLGNIFVYDPTKVDVADFTNPDKTAILIPLRSEAAGTPLNEVILQLELKDFTANYIQEIKMLMDIMSLASGATEAMQGDSGNPDTPATNFTAAQQMAAGRLSSMARIMSEQAIMPQCQRCVKNFQQFLEDAMIVRLRGDEAEFRPEFQGKSSIEIDRNSIQGDFDFVAHDGALPGTDTRAVAAMTKIIESAGVIPQVFDDTKPGNLDLKAMIKWTGKKAGAPIQNFIITPEQAQANLMAQMPPPGMLPPGIPSLPPGVVPPRPPGVPPPLPKPPGMTGESVPQGHGTSLPNAQTIPHDMNPPRPHPAQV